MSSHHQLLGSFTKLLNSLLFRVLVAILAGVLLTPYLPDRAASFLYSVSLSIRTILVWFLPLIIYCYLVSALTAYKGGASKILAGIFAGVIGSFVLALTFVFIMGKACLPHLVAKMPQVANEATRVLTPLWELPWEGLGTDKTILSAIFSGLWLNVLDTSAIKGWRASHYDKGAPSSALDIFKGLFTLGIFARENHLTHFKDVITKLRSLVEKALLSYFVPVIPFYVLGFMVKLTYESTTSAFLHEFSFVILFNFGCILLFLGLGYLVSARGHLRVVGQHIKNMLPATLTAFSTMSSVATMPITIQSVEKNLEGDPHFAKLVIPTTVNPHAIGDVINVALSGLALLVMTGQSLPSLGTYSIFAFYTIAAQFACVAVPGGGIIVMQGVLQKYLGLDNTTVMLLVSIYFLLEPILTATNVTYNGSFVVILRKFLSKFIKDLDSERLSTRA